MIRVARKLSSTDATGALTDRFILRGPPEYIRSDNSPEFVAPHNMRVFGRKREPSKRFPAINPVHFNLGLSASALSLRPAAKPCRAAGVNLPNPHWGQFASFWHFGLAGTAQHRATPKRGWSLSMDPQIYIDAVRYSHLFSIAVGIGASFMADTLVLSQLREPIRPEMLDRLHHYHGIVWIALAAMWISGAAMIYVRTGFDPALFSPKLISKLAVVSMLTLNALLIGRFAVPLVTRCVGSRLLDLPLRQKFCCAGIGAVSTTSWLIALAMGESKVLAASGWSVFLLLVPLAYLTSLVIAGLAIMLLHLRGRNGAVAAE
jgi:hypothetical protein